MMGHVGLFKLNGFNVSRAADWQAGMLCLNGYSQKIFVYAIDPLGQPTVTAGSDQTWRPSVCLPVPAFQNEIAKQNNLQVIIMIAGL